MFIYIIRMPLAKCGDWKFWRESSQKRIEKKNDFDEWCDMINKVFFKYYKSTFVNIYFDFLSARNYFVNYVYVDWSYFEYIILIYFEYIELSNIFVLNILS